MATADSNYDKIIAGVLPELADQITQSILGKQARPKVNLGTNENPGPKPFDIPEITTTFNTDEAAQAYTKAISGENSEYNRQAVKIAAKIQSDTMSQLERDFKMMVHSRVRALAFEAARKLRQSGRNGPIYNNLARGGRLWYNMSGNTNGQS